MTISYYPVMLKRASEKSNEPKERSTTDRILDAAEARFARHGYDATSLNDVADDVGVRTPSLYKHFESKHALYVAVLERLFSPYFELLGRLLVMPEAPEDSAANLLAVLQYYVSTPNLARLVQHATLAGGDELDLIVNRWFAPLFARATELTPHGGDAAGTDPMGVVVAFHAMMSGYMTMAPLHARLTGEDPYGSQAIASQLLLMQRMARELWSPTAPAEPTRPTKPGKPAKPTNETPARPSGSKRTRRTS